MTTETQTDPALMVPDEPGVYWCARHRKVKTRLRCGRCEAPICPRCTIMGPTGARCPDCASNRHSHMYQVKPHQYLLAFGAAFAFGAVGSVLAAALGTLIFWAMLYAPAVGPLLGKVVSLLTQGKRGPKLAFTVSAGLVCGAVGSFAGGSWLMWQQTQRAYAAMAQQPGAPHIPMPPISMLSFLMMNPYGLVFVVLFLAVSIGGVWWWIK